MALIVCIASILPWSRAAYAAPDTEPVKSAVADKLIIQLGPDWAGVEFELTTDMGKYPGTIMVNAAGVLALELADSSTYTLSCLNSKIAAPAAPDEVAQTATPSTDEPLPPATTDTPKEQAPEQSASGNIEADKQPSPPVADTEAAPDLEAPIQETDGIPTLQLVLFIGGAAACVLCLVIIRISRSRRESQLDDDDDY